MPVKRRLWTVEQKPTQIAPTTLADEKALEDMIVAAPEILSDEWMLIGCVFHAKVATHSI